MKHFILMMTAFLLSEMSMVSQTPNHATIEKVQVTYKMVSSAVLSNSVSSIPTTSDIKVMSNAVITLKDPIDAVKVFFKIMDNQTHAVVYQVNYLISSSMVSGSDGRILYVKNNNTLQINCPDIVSLKPYVYEIYTENAQGTATSLYSITK